MKTSQNRKAAGRDWDIFKVKTRHGDSKSQMSRTLNHKNLDGLGRKPDSLSVMGHQKDVKENAYSQISANIQYREVHQDNKSVPRSRPIPVKADAERQLNLINLEKMEKDKGGN